MEVAGVILGVIPIVVEALKAWKTVSSKLRTLRHYSKEIKCVYDKLRVQQCLFENELEVLLSQAGGNGVALAVLKHAAPANSSKLDAEISDFLGRDGETYFELVQNVAIQLDALRNELKSFDKLTDQKRDVSLTSHLDLRRGCSRTPHAERASKRCRAKTSLGCQDLV